MGDEVATVRTSGPRSASTKWRWWSEGLGACVVAQNVSLDALQQGGLYSTYVFTIILALENELTP